jgi:ABC-type multidrug transport system ATPase subunit
MATIISILGQEGCHIHSVKTDKSSLEDVFLNLTGEGIN